MLARPKVESATITKAVNCMLDYGFLTSLQLGSRSTPH
jgi:hypothetical protein